MADTSGLRRLYDAARETLAGFGGTETVRIAALLPATPDAPREVKPAWKTGLSHLLEARPAPQFAPLFETFKQASRLLAWQNDYTEAEAGPGFAMHSAYAEILGPRGHFAADDVAFGVLLMGPDCLYPDHRHAADELYVPIAGRSQWRYDLGGWETHDPGEAVATASNRWHAVRTRGATLVTLYAWTGGDLTQKPELSPPPAPPQRR